MIAPADIKNPFGDYKNSHLGRSGVLFGSGPSLLQFDTTNLPDNVLRFGVNDQIFLDLDLDYWFMGDANPQYTPKFYDLFEHYNEYKPALGKFIRVCKWDEDNRTHIE